MVGREGWLVAGVHDEIMRLNVERTMESRVSEETHFGLKNGDEGRYLDFGRLRGGWFTLPRVWRLSADKPKTSDPTNLQTCINEMKEPILRRRYLFLSLSLSLFPRSLSSLNRRNLRYPWICVWIALVLSEIRVFRERNVFTWFA